MVENSFFSFTHLNERAKNLLKVHWFEHMNQKHPSSFSVKEYYSLVFNKNTYTANGNEKYFYGPNIHYNFYIAFTYFLSNYAVQKKNSLKMCSFVIQRFWWSQSILWRRRFSMSSIIGTRIPFITSKCSWFETCWSWYKCYSTGKNSSTLICLF